LYVFPWSRKTEFHYGHVITKRGFLYITGGPNGVNGSYKRMKIYMAGTPGTSSREKSWLTLIKNRLLSYWDIQEEQFGVPFAFKLIKWKNKRK